MALLLKIFKNKYEMLYNSIISESGTLVPKIVYHQFIKASKGFKPTTLVAPRTIEILRALNSSVLCDNFITAMLTLQYPDRVTNTVSSIRNYCYKDLEFLVEIFKLEIFIRSGDPALTNAVKALWDDLFDEYIEDPKREVEPTITNFTEYLLKKKVEKNVITKVRINYISYSLSASATNEIQTFEVRLHRIILSFFQELESLASGELKFFEIKSIKTEKGFPKPFVVLNHEILSDVVEIHRIKAREHAWPSLVPLNSWSGSFPNFGFGGSLSNKIDKCTNLVHCKSHVMLFDLVLPPELFYVINCFQTRGFRLCPSYNHIEHKSHPLHKL